MAWLRRNGWEEVLSPGDFEFTVYRSGGVAMQVPLRRHFRDYEARFLEMMLSLRRIEGRSMAEIAEEMGR